MPPLPSGRSALARYGVAALLTLAGVAARGALQPVLGNAVPLQMFTLCVVLSAWWGGLGPGLLATALSGLAGMFLFLQPIDSFRIKSAADGIHLAVFIATGVVISWIAESLRRTARREREQLATLSLQEERLRLAVKATQDAIWDWDVATGKVAWNPAVSELFGWTAEEANSTQEWWYRQIHPDDRARITASVQAAAADPHCTHWEAEYRFLRRDGSAAEVMDRGTVLRDSAGRARRMIGAMLDLTERRKMQEDARRDREQLQTIIDTVPALICYVDRHYIYRWNSRGYERWFQRPLHEITGRPMREILGDEVFDRVKPIVDQALAGEICEYEDCLPYRGMEPRWIHALYAPHRGPDGRIDGIAVAVTDISERRQAEVTRGALAAIVEHSEDAIVGKTLEGVVTSWNRAAERLFGYPAEEMIGQHISRLFPPGRSAEVEQILTKLRAGKVIEHYESQRVTKDGRVIEVAVTASPIHDARGKVVGASKIARDITGRKRAEAAAFAEATQRRLAIEAAGMGTWSWSIADGALEWSDRTYEFFDVPAGTPLTFDRWAGALHPDDRDRVNATIAVSLAHEPHQFQSDYRVLKRDGTTRWLLAKGAVQLDSATQRPMRMNGVIMDVTDRVLAAERLASALDAAQAANRAKDAFLAALSHELRTPLTPVLFLAATQERAAEVPAPLREDFAMIRRNIELEARLIDDLLDLTRISRGKLQLELEPTDLHAVVERSVELVRNEIRERRIELSVALGAEQHTASADPMRLQQVVWNLLKNAVKFTPEGGRIAIRSRALPGGEWHLAIEDTGLGITADELPRIFDAFAQGQEASSHRFGGLGLGLAISSLLMREHGGHICAESPGRHLGSTFHLGLPLLSEEPQAEPEVPAHDFSPGGGAARRILVVDDHESTRGMLHRLLTRQGYEVVVAQSAAEAREVAARGRFDLMISDLGLPDGSGHELAREFLREHGLKAIALSGYGMDEDVRQSLAAGFLDHLTKPVDIESLNQAIIRATGAEISR